MTGEPSLDFVLEAGPRAMTPDTPQDVVNEIAKYKCFSPFREAMKRLAQEDQAHVLELIRRTAAENRILEQMYEGKFYADDNFLPDARIPGDLPWFIERQEKESWNPAMREDTLKCYPELKLKIKFKVRIGVK